MGILNQYTKPCACGCCLKVADSRSEFVRGHRPLPSDGDRFWRFVDRRTPDECWPWTGGRHRSGYGNFKVGSGKARRTMFASRVAYWLTTGTEPAPGIVVRHTCHNPPCCNPAHLVLGTHQENKQDSIAVGRFYGFPSGDEHYSHKRSVEWRASDAAIRGCSVCGAQFRLAFATESRRCCSPECRKAARSAGAYKTHALRRR